MLCPPRVVLLLEPRMSNRILFRPGRWITLALGSLCLVTVASFTNAQFNNPPPQAHTVTFAPGSGNTIRGTPIQQRPINNSFVLPGPVYFGGYPTPAQNMPLAPTLPKGFGQS